MDELGMQSAARNIVGDADHCQGRGRPMICPTERSAFPEDVPASSANHVTALPHRL